MCSQKTSKYLTGETLLINSINQNTRHVKLYCLTQLKYSKPKRSQLIKICTAKYVFTKNIKNG